MNDKWKTPPKTITTVNPAPILRVIGIAIVVFVVIVLLSSGTLHRDAGRNSRRGDHTGQSRSDRAQGGLWFEVRASL